MTEQKGDQKSTKPELGLLEEDDEFEEFPAEEWGAEDEDKEDKANVWEDNWDDDNIDDDFSVQLRAELEKQGKAIGIPEPMKT